MLSQVLLEALWWKLHSRDQLNIAGWKMGHEWVDVFLYFLLKTGIFHPANISLPEGTLILFTLATHAPWRLTNCCARRMIWYAIWGVIGCHEKKQVPICQEELLKPKASSWVMVMNNKFCTWCEYPDPTKLDNYIKWIGGSCWWFWDYSTPISWEKKLTTNQNHTSTIEKQVSNHSVSTILLQRGLSNPTGPRHCRPCLRPGGFWFQGCP